MERIASKKRRLFATALGLGIVLNGAFLASVVTVAAPEDASGFWLGKKETTWCQSEAKSEAGECIEGCGPDSGVCNLTT